MQFIQLFTVLPFRQDRGKLSVNMHFINSNQSKVYIEFHLDSGSSVNQRIFPVIFALGLLARGVLFSDQFSLVLQVSRYSRPSCVFFSGGRRGCCCRPVARGGACYSRPLLSTCTATRHARSAHATHSYTRSLRADYGHTPRSRLTHAPTLPLWHWARRG